MQKIIFRSHRHVAASISTPTAKLADAANNTSRIKRWCLDRAPLLQSRFPRERQLQPLPGREHTFMRSLSSAILDRNRRHTVKLSEFSINRSTLRIAPDFHPDKNVASAASHHRMFTDSFRLMNKPSACRREGSSINNLHNDKTLSKKEEAIVVNEHHVSSKKCNNSESSSGTSPINQSAKTAILSQLSSPPNILTLSRIVATPYLSFLLISHYDKGVTASGSVVLGGETTPASVSFPIPVDAASDATTATAAEGLSTIASNIDQLPTPAFALCLCVLMGFTDFLDGHIARRYPSTATVLGSYLDPFADKFFISVTSLTLWYTGSLPAMLVGLWVVRDVGIFGSVYWLVKQETITKQSNRNSDGTNFAIMDPQNTPLKVQASFMSKVNTTLQIGLITLGIAGGVPSITIPSELMTSLIWITAGTTIGSSLGYLDGSAIIKSGNK